MNGLFLVLEGVEGAGKTTQAKLLAEWLTSIGQAVTATREPGGTAVGEAVRHVLLDRGELDINPQSELLLVLAARAAFVRDVVRPALERGDVVVADRFSLSTLAYQGYGRGLDLDSVRTLDAFARAGLDPDLTIVFELDPREGVRRQIAGRKQRDRIERAGEDFHVRVAQGYRLLARSEPGVTTVDALGSPEEVHGRVRAALQRAFPGTFEAPTA